MSAVIHTSPVSLKGIPMPLRSFLFAILSCCILSSSAVAEESETDTEYLTLDYTRVIPLLVEGIKELKTKVETLETKVAALEAE